jgi:DNA-binding NarL/FixJ family response regulator
VILIDDHQLILDGLLMALSPALEIDVRAIARTCAEARAALADPQFDVAIVDVRLPDGSGLELVAEYADRSHPSWIVLSSFETPQYVATAVSSGAAGYLLKTTPGAQIAEAVRRVAAGGTAFTAGQLRTAREQGLLHLTPLERRLVEEVVRARTNEEIGRALGIARKTVEAHLSRLYERYELSSRTELALRAEREGWLDVPQASRSVPAASRTRA